MGAYLAGLRKSSRSMVVRAYLLTALLVAVTACSPSTDGQQTPNESPTTAATSSDPTEFDVDSFDAINPNPEIRALNPEIDLGFYENERIPRDAIEPIYTPKFVTPDESTLQPDEIVMGLEINGDARAYPTGLLRAREMVNDDVGGTPVLVSW